MEMDTNFAQIRMHLVQVQVCSMQLQKNICAKEGNDNFFLNIFLFFFLSLG